MSTKQEPIALLSKDKIENWKLIPKGRSEHYQTSSYDLSLGNYHYVTNDKGTWDHLYIGSDDEGEYKDYFPKAAGRRNALTIPPFGSAIIQLDEYIDTLSVFLNEHTLVAGRFDLKLSTIYKGLISQQATQVEPCYVGRLFCFVHNLGSTAVELTQEKPIATIEFSLVSVVSDDGFESLKETILRRMRKPVAEKYFSIGACTMKAIERATSKTHCNRFESLLKRCNINPEDVGFGIDNVCWFQVKGRLPKECGLTPIHSIVTDKLEDRVDYYLNQSRTVDHITDSVKKKLDEQSNVAKTLIYSIGILLSAVFVKYLLSLQAELKFFKEELALLLAKEANSITPEVLHQLDAHTQELRSYGRVGLIIVFLLLVIALLIVYRFLIPKSQAGKVAKNEERGQTAPKQRNKGGVEKKAKEDDTSAEK